MRLSKSEMVKTIVRWLNKREMVETKERWWKQKRDGGNKSEMVEEVWQEILPASVPPLRQG